MSELIDRAREYAIECHTSTNHMYGDMPYAVHLRDVYFWGRTYQHLIPSELVAVVLAACWCHDVIEDTRQSYNDVKNAVGAEVAEIVYAVTNEKGRNRRERANDKYYEGIRATPGARFVKICDRLANVDNANGSMREMYRKEQQRFGSELYDLHHHQMFEKLQEMLEAANV